MDEEEIELMDIINVLWKRKWIIGIGTLICMVMVGFVSFLLKPIYEISALLQPGKFLVQDEAGRFEEVLIESPKQVASRINEKTYDHLVANALKIPLDEFPEIEAEDIKDTFLVRIWTKNHDIERGKNILNKILLFIKEELDAKIEVEVKGIDSQIRNNEIEKLKVMKEIENLIRKQEIVEKREKELQREMAGVLKRIKTLEREQIENLKNPKRNEAEALGMLLYSNEIQQNLRYYNSLEELLSTKRLDQENIILSIQQKEEILKQIDLTIGNLKEKKGRIDYTKIVKSPTPSKYPVFPKKKLNVALAGILSIMFFSFLSFFLEYIEKHRNQN